MVYKKATSILNFYFEDVSDTMPEEKIRQWLNVINRYMTRIISRRIYLTVSLWLLVVVSSIPASAQQISSSYSSYYPIAGYMHYYKYLPFMAVKTNLLYGIGTLTPNLAVEFGTGQRTTLQLSGSYNPWNRIGTPENNDKLVHWMVRPEFKYWFCERFNGHFLGFNALYNQFNISGKNIPFVDFKKDFRYEGFAIGTGVDYGYQWLLGGRWALEFSAGIGVTRAKYKSFECLLCSELLEEKVKTWFGPTHLSVSLEFMIR